MPELPEVQTTVDGLNKFVKELSITSVWTDYKSSYHDGKDNIKNPDFFKTFKKQVTGASIMNSTRRAKNILINLSNKKVVLFHMKMTGHLLYGDYVYNKKSNSWQPKDRESSLANPASRFIHLVFSLSNGKHLAFSDMRKFAKVTLLDEEHIHTSSHLENIGPEPLDDSFTLKDLKARLNLRPNIPIKQALLMPELIAGIGNIYSDEILWRAGIHPERKVRDISNAEFASMFKATKETLRKGIDFGGDSMSDYRNLLGERGKFQEKHEAYRRTGKPCRRKECRGTIQRKVVGGRSAHFCDTHQK